MVIKPRFSQAEAFCEGLAAVRLPDKQSSSGKLIPGKFGFIDKSRQFIIKPHFEYAQGFKDGIAWVRISVKKNPNKDTSDLCVGYINKKGTYIIKPEFDDIFGFHNSPYAEARKVYRKDRHGNILSSEEGLIDKTGTFIWSERRDSGRKDPFDKGYVLVNMAKGSGYIKPRITRKTFKKGTVDEEYPQIEGMEDKAAQQHINTMLLSRYTLNKYEKGTEYSGTFSLEYNRYSIVSLTVDTGFWAHSPHGYYYMMGYTINTATGKIYELKDLFLQNTSWLGRLNGVVSKEIQSRVNKGELSLFEPFKGIDGTEKFYLSEEKNSLVIFYDLYEISAYVYGRVFVEIPMKDLNDIIKPEFKTII
jgi:hypothetical protein